MKNITYGFPGYTSPDNFPGDLLDYSPNNFPMYAPPGTLPDNFRRPEMCTSRKLENSSGKSPVTGKTSVNRLGNEPANNVTRFPHHLMSFSFYLYEPYANQDISTPIKVPTED